MTPSRRFNEGNSFEWWACAVCGVLGEDEHEECCGEGQTRRTYVAVDALLSGQVVVDATEEGHPLVLDLGTDPATVVTSTEVEA